MQRYTASTQAFIRITLRPEASSIFITSHGLEIDRHYTLLLCLFIFPLFFFFFCSTSFEIAGLRDSLLYHKAPCPRGRGTLQISFLDTLLSDGICYLPSGLIRQRGTWDFMGNYCYLTQHLPHCAPRIPVPCHVHETYISNCITRCSIGYIGYQFYTSRGKIIFNSSLLSHVLSFSFPSFLSFVQGGVGKHMSIGRDVHHFPHQAILDDLVLLHA